MELSQLATPCSAIPEEVWIEIVSHIEDQHTAVLVLSFVSRHLWQLLRKPSRVRRSIRLAQVPFLPHFNVPALHGPSVLAGIRSATALCTWLRTRGAAVESLEFQDGQFAATCVLLVGLMGGVLPALTSFRFYCDNCGWEPAALTSSNLSWLCAELGKCRGLQQLALVSDFSAGWGSAVQWGQLGRLTSLELTHSNNDEEPHVVSVPACVRSLPRLQCLYIGRVSDLCFDGRASRSTLQSLCYNSCSPAERGYALQALPALTKLTASLSELKQLPCSLRELVIYVYRNDNLLTPDSMTCVRSSLHSLNISRVCRFIAGVTGLRNLRHLSIGFTGKLHVPAELRACAHLTALQFEGNASQRTGVHFEQLDLRSFLCLQELAFGSCWLRCNGLLVHAAHLPVLRLLKFEQAVPGSGESVEAVCELDLALRVLGKDRVLHIEPFEVREEWLGLE